MKKENIFTKHPILKHLCLMLGISLVILIIAFILIKIYARHGKEYILPDLVGQNIEALRNDNPLELEYVIIDSTYVKGEEGGIIITQEPKDSTMVKKGRKIYVTISSYKPADAVVPKLTDGTSLRQAISYLEAAGLQGGKLTFVESPYKDVMKQSHNGREIYEGEKLPKGSYIDLVVGMGENPKPATVPFVLNRSVEKARRDILLASLNVGKEHYSDRADRTKAVVYHQEPEYTGAAYLPLGSEVELWYCNPEDKDVERIVREFQVDSSKIQVTGGTEEEDDFEIEF